MANKYGQISFKIFDPIQINRSNFQYIVDEVLVLYDLEVMILSVHLISLGSIPSMVTVQCFSCKIHVQNYAVILSSTSIGQFKLDNPVDYIHYMLIGPQCRTCTVICVKMLHTTT